ncbi:MAG: phosphatidate cytidylyltransferase [Alphaproteobacteria bacterium]|nr:phosphatidate cytidylyltransferase [Alphaproteobacteria bacterium]
MSVTRPIPDGDKVFRRGVGLSSDWITRPLFGLLLAALAIAADFGGETIFALFIAAGAALAAREWHRMVIDADMPPLPETAASIVVLLAALLVLALAPYGYYSWAILAAGAIGIAALSSARGGDPAWQGAGILYVGVPALALVACRAVPAHGAWIVLGAFLAVWASDTGALVAGNLVGGPRLVPALSPNKTWSGTVGGIAAAALCQAAYIGAIGGSAWRGAIYGAALAVAAQAGDLFESFVKRRFHRKDSGHMIPGHGGVLDRIDSLLAAALGLAAFLLLMRLDPLFGAKP